MSATPTILVTGASGRLGRLLVPRLLERQVQVRVLSRHPEQLPAEWAGQVAAFQGDSEHGAALRAACQGSSHLFLLTPITEDLFGQQQRMVQAALDGGITHVVKLSGSDWTIRPPGRSLSGDAHHRVERWIQRSGVSRVILRPNAWMQVLLARTVSQLRSADTVSGLPEAPVSYLDARDIADVAVAALLDHPRLVDPQIPGSDIWVLTGGQAWSPVSLAQTAAQLTGRPIRAVPTPAAPDSSQGASSYAARVHAQFAQLLAAGAGEGQTATVERVLGRRPRTLEAFLREALVADGRSGD